MNKPRPVYTKSRLIKELAFRAGITKVASRQILETGVSETHARARRLSCRRRMRSSSPPRVRRN